MLISMLRFLRQSPVLLLLRLTKVVNHTYLAGFLAAGLSSGILQRLASAPASAEELHREMGMRGPVQGLQAWLELGVGLGELRRQEDGYALKGRHSKGLLAPGIDTWRAFLETRVSVFLDQVVNAPARLLSGELPGMDPAQGERMAQASRSLEPILFELIDRSLPAQEPCRLLEVGCGTGVYIRRACQVNPRLTAVGLEVQEPVAEMARANLANWGLAERASVITADIRDFADPEGFDLVTLHNLIYYFPLEQRVEVLRRLGANLKPGGTIWLTSLCHSPEPSVATLNLWSSMTKGCGPLPTPEQLSSHMAEAGLTLRRRRKLFPNFWLLQGAYT